MKLSQARLLGLLRDVPEKLTFQSVSQYILRVKVKRHYSFASDECIDTDSTIARWERRP